MNFLKSTDDLIDSYYTASWNSTLPFPGCVLCHKTAKYEESESTTIDLFRYCGNSQYRDKVIRFDPKVYHVPSELSLAFIHTSDGWKLLQTITLSLANSSQGNFVSNGSKSVWKGQRREIICARYKVFSRKKAIEGDLADSAPFRDITFRNNPYQKKKVAKKCTTTSLPVDRAEKCSCRLMIGVDSNSYFIFCSFGNSLHCNHPMVHPSETVTKKRHVSLDCIDTIREFAFCKTTVGSALLASSFKHDARLSRRQCAHIMTTEGMKAAFQDVELGETSTVWTAPEEMYHLFKKKKIFFGMLYHRKDIIESERPGWNARRLKKTTDLESLNDENLLPTAQIAAVSTTTSSTGEVVPSDGIIGSELATIDAVAVVSSATASTGEAMPTDGIIDNASASKGVCIFETFLPKDDNDDPTVPKVLDDDAPLDLANKCRQDFEARDDQDIVLSLVWATPEMRRLFCAYPEVLFIDGTHKTNNEKYPLFTVGIRDANFKVRIVLRAFCPNERGWMFDWFFSEAIPSILGANACKRVKTIITDGDSQETKGLDKAIGNGVYGSAIRRRCGWHIIHQGCKNILLRRYITSRNISEDLKVVISNVKAWIQESLMKEIEDAREYEISKAILFNYINSNLVTEQIGRTNVGHILNFLRGHIFVHEDHFASYIYNRHRTLLEYSNTPLEGTNGGLKYGYFAVQPHMKISTSASYMICQDEYRHTEQKRTAHVNSCNTKLYNLDVEGSKEANRIVPKALGEMQKQIALGHMYCSLRMDSTTWLVRIGKDETIDLTTRMIPVFRRIRKVQRMDPGGFRCSCPFSSTFGIPCRHVAHVLRCYSSELYLFDHHDVDVRWWATYADFVASKTPSSLNDKEMEIKERLLDIRQNFKLEIGRKAKTEAFHMKKFVCGQDVSTSLNGMSLATATQNIFSDVVSYPCNYSRNHVDQAVVALKNTYGGINMTYCRSDDFDGDDIDDSGGVDIDHDDISGGNIDDGNGDDNDGGGALDDGGDDGYIDSNTLGIGAIDNVNAIDDTTMIDYADRIVTRPEARYNTGPRYTEMQNPIKELFSFIENCDAEFYDQYKKDFEETLCRARRNVISQQKRKDQLKGSKLSCMPTNVKNTERKHKKQRVV